MASTIGGQDEDHDLPGDEKDHREKELREEGRKLRRQKRPKDAKKKFDRATEISRRKSKSAQHH